MKIILLLLFIFVVCGCTKSNLQGSSLAGNGSLANNPPGPSASPTPNPTPIATPTPSATPAPTPISTATPVSGNSLPALAARMTHGQWAQLITNNFNGGNILRPPDGGSGLEYSERAQWNPINRTVMILGGAHPGNSTDCNSTFLAAYSVTTNTWVNNLPSPCPNFDTARGIVSINLVHPYDHQDIVPSTGDLYHRQYSSGKIMKFSQASQSWSQCSPYNTSGTSTSWVDINEYQSNGSLVYFPDRNSLIFLDGDWGLYELSLASGNCNGTWNLLASGNGGYFSPQLTGQGSHDEIGQYSSLCQCVIIGGGSNQMFKIDSKANITKLAPSPTYLGIPANSGTAYGSIFTVDPVGGHFLVWSGNVTDNGLAYDYNPLTDTWVKTGISSPIFPVPEGGVTDTVAVPIPEYGVILFVQAGSSSGGSVYVYKP